jgi:hypothetical protein
MSSGRGAEISKNFVRYTCEPMRVLRGLVVALPVFLCGATPSFCQSLPRGILCTAAGGSFDSEFRTGVKVHVGAARNGELATRACAARLTWEKQELVIATGVSQLDLDAFGVDLGDGVPVAGFQTKESDDECCMEYKVYSLEKPPRLLRTITGGDFFSATDVDLDGRVEIWTNDGVGVDGFESLSLSELDFPPIVVFRFARGHLLDVSAEFQSYFDDEIAKIRGGIHPQELADFKASDGKLPAVASPANAEQLHRLRTAKIKVLEIVWAYLYSGREQEAWHSLAEMWRAADLDRIHAALVNARARGIHSQADGASTAPARGRKKRAQIFDAVTKSGPDRQLEVIPPSPILLRRPPAPEIQEQGPTSEVFLDLVIDAAGKVRSAEPAAKTKGVDPDLINAALSWKFIPAFKDRLPVASRLRLGVSSRQ